MADRRSVEVFSSGCYACDEIMEFVERVACSSCDVTVLDANEPDVARRAKALGVRSVPAVAVDGRLVECCDGRGPEESTLRAAGIGQPL